MFQTVQLWIKLGVSSGFRAGPGRLHDERIQCHSVGTELSSNVLSHARRRLVDESGYATRRIATTTISTGIEDATALSQRLQSPRYASLPQPPSPKPLLPRTLIASTTGVWPGPVWMTYRHLRQSVHHRCLMRVTTIGSWRCKQSVNLIRMTARGTDIS